MAEIEDRHHARPYYFAPTISLGNLLAILTIIGSVFLAYNDVTTRLTRGEERIDGVKEQLSDIKGQLADINLKLRKMGRASETLPVWGEPP